uniref:Uncharacterized protein n=1 Tax=Oryza glumipatula TaxID=40148 RepID=A0A0E0AZD3_9ORYZ
MQMRDTSIVGIYGANNKTLQHIRPCGDGAESVIPLIQQDTCKLVPLSGAAARPWLWILLMAMESDWRMIAMVTPAPPGGWDFSDDALRDEASVKGRDVPFMMHTRKQPPTSLYMQQPPPSKPHPAAGLLLHAAAVAIPKATHSTPCHPTFARSRHRRPLSTRNGRRRPGSHAQQSPLLYHATAPPPTSHYTQLLPPPQRHAPQSPLPTTLCTPQPSLSPKPYAAATAALPVCVGAATPSLSEPPSTSLYTPQPPLPPSLSA